MTRYLFLMIGSLSLAFAAAPTGAHAQDALRGDPGYLDLSTVEGWFEAEPWLEVNIRGALLNLIVEASRSEEEPELTDLLSKLKAIEVRGYRLTPAMFDDISRRTGQLARDLQNQGWETVVRVREEQEQANVFLKTDGRTIAGLVVMVVNPSDDDGAVFVNIVGDIDPADVGRIGRKFNIEPLSGLR